VPQEHLVEKNLQYYGQKLVTRAASGEYSLHDRVSFLVAVGAAALQEQENEPEVYPLPSYHLIAVGVLGRLSALELVASVDDDMAYWEWVEWGGHVREAFDMIKADVTDEDTPDFSAAGCTMLLEYLANGRAHIELPEV
jgi:hypothetical protein